MAWTGQSSYCQSCVPSQVNTCSSSRFTFVRVRLLSCFCAVTFVIFPMVLVGPFSALFFLLCPDLSSYNPHLSCALPRFRQPTCFFVSDLFCNLSSFFLTISSPFHPALTEAILLIHLFLIFGIFKLQSRVVSSV